MFFKNLIKNFKGMQNFSKARGIGAARARMNPQVPRRFSGGMFAKLMQKSRNQMNPNFGGGFFGKFKFPKPPSVEAAQNRSMGNVGLLPSYMQPGGSGLPSDSTPFDDVADPLEPAPGANLTVMPPPPGANLDIMPPLGPGVNKPNPELKPYPLDASKFTPDMFNLNLPKVSIGGMQAPDFRNLNLGNVFGRRMFQAGGAADLKPIPEGNKGLPKLPKAVRNNIGFMADGGLASVPGYAGGEEVVADPVPGIDMPSGSDADMMNYQNTLMALRQLKANLPANQQQFFDSAVQEILGESGSTISRQDRVISSGIAPIAKGFLRSRETMLTPRDELLMKLLPPGTNVVPENSRLRTLSNLDKKIIQDLVND